MIIKFNESIFVVPGKTKYLIVNSSKQLFSTFFKCKEDASKEATTVKGELVEIKPEMIVKD